MSLILLCTISSLNSEECPALLNDSYEARRMGEMRVKAVRGWDKLLTWAFASKIRPYPLASPLTQIHFRGNYPELLALESRFGFFSMQRPLVGMVTEDERDSGIAQCFLNSIHELITDPMQRQFASDEFLAKAVAYRSLQVGQEITVGETVYLVDQVMNLWRGMPAFGLVPKNNQEAVPILLYRGTDLSLTREKGWASVLSDLDVAGPGFRTFHKARPQIEEWLKKQVAAGTPARLLGFSLGGSFVLYSVVEMPELINQKVASIAFGSPGVSPEVVARWQRMKEKEHPPHLIYLNQGDLASQIGAFFSKGYQVALDRPLQVIEAHVTLMGIQPDCTLTLLGAFVVDR